MHYGRRHWQSVIRVIRIKTITLAEHEDILFRLHKQIFIDVQINGDKGTLLGDAADEIERLRAEIERLEEERYNILDRDPEW